MKPSTIRWTAVAVFAAVMTVAEAFALHAATKDAKRWISSASDSAREIQLAGSAVAAAVTGAAYRECSDGDCVVIVKTNAKDAAHVSPHEARVRLRELRRLNEARWSLLPGEI